MKPSRVTSMKTKTHLVLELLVIMVMLDYLGRGLKLKLPFKSVPNKKNISNKQTLCCLIILSSLPTFSYKIDAQPENAFSRSSI